MREIKFRMWNNVGDNSRMFYDTDEVMACLKQQLLHNNPTHKYNKLGWDHEANGNVFMQYTGLKDNKGVEIYDGDIIFNDDRVERCVVEWSEEKAMFVVTYVETKDSFPLWETLSNLYYYVGNIYESPALLTP